MSRRQSLLLSALMALGVWLTAARTEAATFRPAGAVLAGNSTGSVLAAAWSECGDASRPSPQVYGAPRPTPPCRVMVTVRESGQGWSRPVAVSDPHVRAREAHVVVDEAGDAMVVWQVIDDLPTKGGDVGFTTAGRWRMADGAWTPSQELPGFHPQVQQTPLLIAGDGTATLVGQTDSLAAAIVGAAPGRPFGPAQSVPQVIGLPSVAAASDGTLLFAGQALGARVRVVFRRPDGRTSAPVDLVGPGSPDPFLSAPLITAAADGGALVSWTITNAPDVGHVAVARFTPDGALSGSTTLQQPTSAGRAVKAQSVDADGTLTLLVDANPYGLAADLSGVSVDPGGQIRQTVSLSAPDAVFSPIVTSTDDQGATVAAWPLSDGRIRAAARPPNGVFAPLTIIAGPNPQAISVREPAVLQRPLAQLVAWDDAGTIQLLTRDGGPVERRALAERAQGPTTWVDPSPHGVHAPQVARSGAVVGRSGPLSLRLTCSRTVLSCDALLSPSIGRSKLTPRTVHVRAHHSRTFLLRLDHQARARARAQRRLRLAFKATRNGTIQRQTTSTRIAVRRG